MKTKTFTFATTLLLPFVSSLLSFIFCLLSFVFYLLPFIFCLLSLPTTAQVPQSFKYQAALRDDGGKIMANQLVSMRITISNSSGTLYAEEHISTTTDYGLVHLNIGKGHVLSGVFIGIDWSADEHFMQLEVNTGGGYVDMGTTQLLSVPYALHAGSATSLTGPVSESDPVFTASPSFGITMAHIDNWQSAYSWGDHAMAGYLTSFSEADPLFSLSPSYGIASSDISNWNIAFGWGDHAAAGYLTSFSEADPTWNGAANTGSTIGRTGNVGIGTTSPKALLHTHGTGSGEGNVLFTGSYKDTPGDPPATGAGTRMMWYPDKAAFRAGIVGSYHWDKDSIGNYSVSMGRSTKAIGAGSFSAGWYTSASGSYSVAMGANSEATGHTSTALGNYAKAIGSSSTAIGVSTTASGYRSIAMGANTIAQSGYETVIGRYNTDYSPNSTGGWNAGDRLFVIGNGTSSVNRSDAISVLKNGDVGIGTSSPDARLEISGSGVQRLRIHSSSSTPGEVSIDFLRAGSTNYDWRIRNTNGDLRFSWSNNDLSTVNDLITLRHTLGRVGIGTISPLAQLHTTGTVRFAGAGTPGTGKVLTSDAQGNATWQSSPLSCMDIEGNAYPTIVIGNQVWMAENLRVTKYNNGDDIPNVTGYTAWSTLTTGAYCWYGNNQSENAKYGALYNWHAVNDPRGLCPEGWRVPKDAEWTAFTNMLGGADVAGGKLKAVSTLWDDPNTYATNSTGFSALPGGLRTSTGGFSSIGRSGFWWSSTEYSSTKAWDRYMNYTYGSVLLTTNIKTRGLSVRCIRDL